MAYTPLPLNTSAAPGLEELAGAPAMCVNMTVDAVGAVRVRPGIATWADFPTTVPNASPVIGIFPWKDYLLYVTEDRKIFALTGYQSVTALSSSAATSKLAGAHRPVFAETETRALIAGGGDIQKWEGIGHLAERLGGSPPKTTHVVASYQRVVASRYDNSGRFEWSDTLDSGHETWPAEYAVADGRPDPIVAMLENTNELFVFGKTTLQVFGPDPIQTFATQRPLNLGIAAAYSPIRADDHLAWLDHQRRFVVSNGQGYDVISAPTLNRTLQALGTVSDCWGFRAAFDNFDALVWVFPTEGRTFVFNALTKHWSEWRSYSDGDWSPLVIQSYAYWADKNVHLVGMSDGSIRKLDAGTYTEDGEAIPGVFRTGFIHSPAVTHCKGVRLRFKRGVGDGVTVPVAELSYRDKRGEFCTPYRLSLGAPSDVVNEVVIRTLGTYASRQWQITMACPFEFVLASAEVEEEILEV